MDRRDFLVASGSAVMAGAGLSGPLHQAFATPLPADRTRQLTLTVADAGNASWTTGQARELARRIEQASSGGYAVSVASPASGTASALNVVSAAQLVERDAAFAFATGLPGSAALDAEAVDTWLTTAGGQSALDELAASHGLKVLLAGHGGEAFLWSAKPLHTAADFAGKCVQAEGLACYVAAGLGAEPWRIVPGTAPGGLTSGAVAAIEATVPDAIHRGIVPAARYASANALAPRGTAVALTLELDVWRAMTPADRAVMSSAAQESYRDSIRINRLGTDLHRHALQHTCAIDVSPVPHGLAAQIQTVARAVVAQTAAISPFAAKLNASYMSFLKSQQDLPTRGPAVSAFHPASVLL